MKMIALVVPALLVLTHCKTTQGVSGLKTGGGAASGSCPMIDPKTKEKEGKALEAARLKFFHQKMALKGNELSKMFVLAAAEDVTIDESMSAIQEKGVDGGVLGQEVAGAKMLKDPAAGVTDENMNSEEVKRVANAAYKKMETEGLPCMKCNAGSPPDINQATVAASLGKSLTTEEARAEANKMLEELVQAIHEDRMSGELTAEKSELARTRIELAERVAQNAGMDKMEATAGGNVRRVSALDAAIVGGYVKAIQSTVESLRYQPAAATAASLANARVLVSEFKEVVGDRNAMKDVEAYFKLKENSRGQERQLEAAERDGTINGKSRALESAFTNVDGYLHSVETSGRRESVAIKAKDAMSRNAKKARH